MDNLGTYIYIYKGSAFVYWYTFSHAAPLLRPSPFSSPISTLSRTLWCLWPWSKNSIGALDYAFSLNMYCSCTSRLPEQCSSLCRRQHPELVKDVFVLNADKFQKDYPAFDAFTSVLDIVQDRKTSFLPRFRLPWYKIELSTLSMAIAVLVHYK